jgi:superfamily II DNA helicase RecQ
VLGTLPGCPVTYKSPDQKRALEAVVQGVSPLIVVLPTRGGKTLPPMAAAVLDSSQQADQPRVTILVLPFRALIEDMLVRLQRAGITAAEWQPGAHNELENRRMLASVVLVSADHVGSSSGQFLSYAALLAQQQILRRVVVDECHTAITADSWRPKLTKLRDVRLLPCQLVLLTATLPPSREEELRKALLVPTATIVRAETTQRAGTQYAVVQCQEQQELAETAVQLAHRLMEEARAARAAAPACTGAAASAVGKGIVYCRSRRLCERLAALLDCPAYHADVASRTELLQAWRQHGGLIVSTSALGVGVDIPYVWFTLHVQQPWSMVDFVQESGRARAQGKAVIFAVQQGQRCGEGEGEEEGEDDSLAIAAFVRATSCRRAVMSQYMDGVPVCCRELQGRATAGGEEVASCDNCERRTAEEQQQQRQQQRRRRGSGQAAWQEATQLQAVQEQLVCAKLTELAQSTCPYC